MDFGAAIGHSTIDFGAVAENDFLGCCVLLILLELVNTLVLVAWFIMFWAKLERQHPVLCKPLRVPG